MEIQCGVNYPARPNNQVLDLVIYNQWVSSQNKISNFWDCMDECAIFNSLTKQEAGMQPCQGVSYTGDGCFLKAAKNAETWLIDVVGEPDSTTTADSAFLFTYGYFPSM